MLDVSITKRKIGERHDKTEKDSDEPELDGDNVQLSIDQQPYGQQSITSDSYSMTMDCDLEITKGREILKQTDSMMKESSKEYDRSSTSRNYIPRRVARQLRQSA